VALHGRALRADLPDGRFRSFRLTSREILTVFEARCAAFYGPEDALSAAEADRLTRLCLLVSGMLGLGPG
jgi:hypothetical protein